jgi:hypothetical protein
MPIKLFQDGEILDASDVNTYFMDQAIVVFDDSTQRDAAFGGALEPGLSEGRICYLKSDDTIYIYTGSAWTAQLANIADGAITTVRLNGTAGSEAVTTAKIRDLNVTEGKIAAGAVTSAKLGSDLDLNGTTEIDEVLETVVVNGTALTGTVQIDAKSGSVHYFTANSAANWVWNLRGDGSTTLNSMMDIGQSITFALFATNGSPTAYKPTSITVDTSGTVAVKWFGGNAYPSGNVSSIDCYTITVVKTASSTFTVFASQSKFA